MGWSYGYRKNGPDGWNNVVYDTKFPLHGSLDPINAHPYSLLGKLNNYFFIGSKGRGKERFIYPMYVGENPLVEPLYGVPYGIPLLIRINDDTPGNGNGSFNLRLKVWKSSIILPLPLPTWISLGGTLTSEPAVI